MTSVLRTTPFSVLDRSLTRQGRLPGEALRDTVRFAQQAEALGYHRFWVAEHHGVPGAAGSAPTVLAAAVAAATSRIRVGTGGVMLPNHRPLVVAEQFGVLESLFPGRIDMGLGRSVGFTDGVRRALGGSRDDAMDFGAQLAELLGYFTGDGAHGVHALPAEDLRLPVFVLATGAGADQAAASGLPLVIALSRDEERMLRAIDRYRSGFRPSAWSERPRLTVAADVAVAATEESARQLQTSEAWATAYSRIHGVFPPLVHPEEIREPALTPRERTLFEDSLRGRIRGTEDSVGAALTELVERTGADEVLVTLSGFDQERRWESYRRLAALTTGGRPEATAAR